MSNGIKLLFVFPHSSYFATIRKWLNNYVNIDPGNDRFISIAKGWCYEHVDFPIWIPRFLKMQGSNKYAWPNWKLVNKSINKKVAQEVRQTWDMESKRVPKAWTIQKSTSKNRLAKQVEKQRIRKLAGPPRDPPGTALSNARGRRFILNCGCRGWCL